jgi:uncharacterized membrane protein YfcA
VQPWIPPLVAFVISFFTSMGGVSGAFLLLPFQMSFYDDQFDVSTWGIFSLTGRGYDAEP